MEHTERNLRILSLLLVLFAGAYLWGATSLPLGQIHQPEAGLFPCAAGVFLLVLSLMYFLKIWWTQGEWGKTEPLPRGKDFHRVMGLLVALVGYAALLEPLGFILASIALTAVVLRLLHMRSWGSTLLISVLAAAVSYFLFGVILGVPFPAGVLRV